MLYNLPFTRSYAPGTSLDNEKVDASPFSTDSTKCCRHALEIDNLSKQLVGAKKKSALKVAEQTQAIPIAGATPVIGDAAAIRTALADILGLITEQEELTLEAASQQKSPRW